MPDFEHPSATGYQAWAEAIEPEVAKLMDDAAHHANPPTLKPTLSRKLLSGLVILNLTLRVDSRTGSAGPRNSLDYSLANSAFIGTPTSESGESRLIPCVVSDNNF
jgi:hypothetical protein